MHPLLRWKLHNRVNNSHALARMVVHKLLQGKELGSARWVGPGYNTPFEIRRKTQPLANFPRMPDFEQIPAFFDSLRESVHGYVFGVAVRKLPKTVGALKVALAGEEDLDESVWNAFLSCHGILCWREDEAMPVAYRTPLLPHAIDLLKHLALISNERRGLRDSVYSLTQTADPRQQDFKVLGQMFALIGSMESYIFERAGMFRLVCDDAASLAYRRAQIEEDKGNLTEAHRLRREYAYYEWGEMQEEEPKENSPTTQEILNSRNSMSRKNPSKRRMMATA
jgi:hypothetical protein